MAENRQHPDRNQMISPYFPSYSQGRQSGGPVSRPNMAMGKAAGGQTRNRPVLRPDEIPGRPVYADRSQAKTYVKYQKYSQQEYDAYAKRKKKERDYFFVMRKGACFLMFVFAVLILAVLALSIVDVPAVGQYTSVFVEPDNTPEDMRGEGYEDATAYISFKDPIFGFIEGFTKKEANPDEANPEEPAASPYTFGANARLIAGRVADVPEDSMGSIASLVYQYFPITIALIAILAFVVVIISIGGMAGSRIFKGYGALAIVMLVLALVVAVAGLAVMGAKMGNPQIGEDGTVEASILDFSRILDYLTRVFSGAPETTIDTETTAPAVPYAAGFGLLVLIVAPLAIAVTSLFARQKVPYSVFDR